MYVCLCVYTHVVISYVYIYSGYICIIQCTYIALALKVLYTHIYIYIFVLNGPWNIWILDILDLLPSTAAP